MLALVLTTMLSGTATLSTGTAVLPEARWDGAANIARTLWPTLVRANMTEFRCRRDVVSQPSEADPEVMEAVEGFWCRATEARTVSAENVLRWRNRIPVPVRDWVIAEDFSSITVELERPRAFISGAQVATIDNAALTLWGHPVGTLQRFHLWKNGDGVPMSNSERAWECTPTECLQCLVEETCENIR